MGRVTVVAIVENLKDLYEMESGTREPDDVRRVTIDAALVDTGARSLSLPISMIRQLGLAKFSERRVITSAGPGITGLYGVVRLSVQGRECYVDVTEVPDSVPALIGQIPLESMDFVVDPSQQRLIGNPAHGGEHIIELF